MRRVRVFAQAFAGTDPTALGSHVCALAEDAWLDYPAEFLVGTACSGTDLVIGVLRELEAWWAPYGFRTRFKHAFSCDTKTAAKDFIMACWKPEALSEFMGSGGSGGRFPAECARQLASRTLRCAMLV